MKKILFILLTTTFSFASEALWVNDFNKANELYYNENYDSALTVYSKLKTNGVTHPHLYFNMGNAYFKLGRYDEAVYYFEKAKMLYPRDKEIEKNLTKARLLLKDKIEPINKTFFIKWYDSIVSNFTFHEVLIIFNACFILSFIILVIMIYRKNHREKILLYMLIFFFIISILSGAWTKNRYDYLNGKNKGIVFSGTEIEVKVGPRMSDETAFVIHSGVKVKKLRNREDWTEIYLENGYTGWIESKLIRYL